jgi:hypothetical protein
MDAKYLDEFAAKKRILVINKVDLPRRLELPQAAVLPSHRPFGGKQR